jgi:hypothetical protein
MRDNDLTYLGRIQPIYYKERGISMNLDFYPNDSFLKEERANLRFLGKLFIMACVFFGIGWLFFLLLGILRFLRYRRIA